MKPLKFKHAQAAFLEGRLLMLNSGVLGTRYVARLLDRGTASVTSKGGTALLPELWSNILVLSRMDAYALVKAQLVSETEERKVLECEEVELDVYAGELEGHSEVSLCEHVLNRRGTNDEALEGRDPPNIMPGDTTYRVVLEAGDEHPCIFAGVTVPDVIARLEGGECGFCGGRRFICPGCTGGRAQGFDVFMGCGVDLACPLCLGCDIALEHKGFLRAYYDEPAPEEEEEEMDGWVSERLVELGYPPLARA